MDCKGAFPWVRNVSHSDGLAVEAQGFWVLFHQPECEPNGERGLRGVERRSNSGQKHASILSEQSWDELD